MNKTIVSVSGYGDTGASAVMDILKGFTSVETLDDFEFQIHYFPDGIGDLDYALNESCSRFYDSDVAIMRFLKLCKHLDGWYEPAFHGKLYSMAQEYIDSLCPVVWNGYWAFDRLYTPQEQIDQLAIDNNHIRRINLRRSFCNRFLRKAHLPQIKLLEYKQYRDLFSSRPMYMCAKPADFLQKTRDFSERLISVASQTEAPIKAVNMLLPPNNPVRYYKYFTSPVKNITVARDPRDIYVHLKYYKWQVIPYDNVDTFISWYRETFKAETNVSHSSILRINFEDLVYEYEDTVKSICDFLGIQESINDMSKFDPHVSVVNTQSYRQYPQYAEDIKKIESELSEYLYDFSSHAEVACKSDLIF